MLSTILMGREPYSRADICVTVDRLKRITLTKNV